MQLAWVKKAIENNYSEMHAVFNSHFIVLILLNYR